MKLFQSSIRLFPNCVDAKPGSLMSAVLAIGLVTTLTGCRTTATMSSPATPCMAVLDRFTAPSVPAFGPGETVSPVGNWTNAVTPAGLPGNGLAQHPMLYVGENCTKMFLVNDGKVIWTAAASLESQGVFGVAAPAAAQGTVIAGFSSGELNAYRYENGINLWGDVLSRSSITSRSAVFRPMPGHFASKPTSPAAMADLSVGRESLLITLSAIFGPTPVTFSTNKRKKSRSGSVAKPYRVAESSRYTARVCSFAGWPGEGRRSAVVTGMWIS